jgi:hypothetical protein
MEPVAVLIFVHKPELEWFEEISLRQCQRVLARHPLYLVYPRGLDIGRYLELAPALRKLPTDPRHLASYQAYNQFKIGPELYRCFQHYEYLLTYELDAFVFRDELLEWCSKKLDYVGAPWFEGFSEANPHAAVIGVGNSGFSLRRTKAILNVNAGWSFRSGAIEAFVKWRNRRHLTPGSLVLLVREMLRAPESLSAYRGQEDGFWCHAVPRRFPDFRIADYESARQFSFEVNPSRLFRECKNELPFGCHKWMQWEPDFWKHHITRFGYDWPESVAR